MAELPAKDEVAASDAIDRNLGGPDIAQ